MRCCLSAGADTTVKLWESATGTCLNTATTCYGPVCAHNFDAHTGHAIVFNAEQRRPALLDVRTGRFLHTLSDLAIKGHVFFPAPDQRTWLFVNNAADQLAILRVPTFEHRSAFDLCKIESSEAVGALEAAFYQQAQQINEHIERMEIDLALEKVNALRAMPLWGESSALMALRQQVGAYCTKTGIARIVQVDASSWDVGAYEHELYFGFSPERRVTAMLYANAPPASGVDCTSVLIHDARTGELLQKIAATAKGENLQRLWFSQDGTKLMATYHASSLPGWGGRIFAWETGEQEETLTSAISHDDLYAQAVELSFHKGHAMQHASAQRLFQLEQSEGSMRTMHVCDVSSGTRTALPAMEKSAKGGSFSPDGNHIQIVYRPYLDDDHTCTYVTYALDWDYHFPGQALWHDDALPYLTTFLAHYPDDAHAHFDLLLTYLQRHGYGWLLPQGVRAKLDELLFGW